MDKNQSKKNNLIPRLVQKGKTLWHFFSYDIWRLSDHDVSGIKHRLYNIAKTIILSVRFFISDRLQEKASALTYNSLLAIVPVLALLLAITRGFGFHGVIEQQLVEFFPGQQEFIIKAFNFVDSYLQQTQSGVIVGIGVVFLIWAVISLIGNIETVFNHIWQIKRSRTYYRRFTDYLSMVLIIPVLMISSSGLSIFVSTGVKSEYFQFIIDPLTILLVKIAPYAITCLLFTVVYIVIPNTKVKFSNAFWAGIVAGSAFQIFQFFYINGQIWVSRYNAIYGSFAALPLLLLWVQLSWLICLFGAELAYASQNIRSFNFEQDTNNISRRYYDFITILIASLIVKRFHEQKPPLTNEQISSNYQIPSKLTSQILSKLADINIISEVCTTDDRQRAWQPALDINQITVGMILKRVDQYGIEAFKIDKEVLFAREWQTLLKVKEIEAEAADKIKLMDLE